MKATNQLLLLAILSCPLTGCYSTTEDTPTECGPEIHNDFQWERNKTDPWNDTTWYSYTEGNERIFQVSSALIENVCPDNHITFLILGRILLPCPRNIQVRVLYRYSLFGNTVIPEKKMNNVEFISYEGGSTFGIKQVFDEIPGSFWLQYEWVIENYQDYEVDLEYFKSVFDYAEINCTHWEY